MFCVASLISLQALKRVLGDKLAILSDPEYLYSLTSLLVLVDRAQVKRGGRKLGPGWTVTTSPKGGGGLDAPPFVILTNIRVET